MPRNYLPCPVDFVDGLFDESSEILAEALKRASGSESPRILIVADANVVQRTEALGAKIGRYLKAHALTLATNPVVLSGGEKIKCDHLESVQRVLAAAVPSGIGAGDVALVLGGGTVIDVAGFTLALVRGGIATVRIPTTPEAMMDAAFAVRGHLDGSRFKDVLSVAAPPARVLIDLAFAETVLDGVWRAGFVEAVRLAAARDKKAFETLRALAPVYARRDMSALKTAVETVLKVRTAKGGSALALWAAKKLEAMSDYKLPYGYALALGLSIEAAYAQTRALVTAEERELLTEPLVVCGAMEGALHSRHLLLQADDLLAGIDEARRSDSAAIEFWGGFGKTLPEDNPDKGAIKAALDLIK